MQKMTSLIAELDHADIKMMREQLISKTKAKDTMVRRYTIKNILCSIMPSLFMGSIGSAMSIILLITQAMDAIKGETFKMVDSLQFSLRTTPIKLLIIVVTLICPTSWLSNKIIDTIDNMWYDRYLANMVQQDNRTYGYGWEKVPNKNGSIYISKYWAEKGMESSRLHNVELVFDDPVKEHENILPGLTLYNHIDTPSYANALAETNGFADQSDTMHVKAIVKRIAGPKTQPDKKTIERFMVKMNNLYGNLETYIEPFQHYINKALTTRGSAGQFAKHADFGILWKNSEFEMETKAWEDMVSLLYASIYNGLPVPLSIETYMIYRKMEILPKDEEGNMKVTRLMQAPNLVIRVADSCTFTPYNEYFSIHRDQVIPNIGLRIERQLAIQIGMTDLMMHVESDFSDYDGSQSSGILRACKLPRMNTWTKSKVSHEEKRTQLSYLNYKYNLLMTRPVNTTWGIHGKLFAQQASGDITTSDDNSTRSAVYLTMVEEAFIDEILRDGSWNEIRQLSCDENNTDKIPEASGIKICQMSSEMIKQYTNDNKIEIQSEIIDNVKKTAGDDTHVKLGMTIDTDKYKQNCYKMAKKLGFNLKEVNIIKPIDFGGKPVILGHSVEWIYAYVNETQLMVPVIMRPDDRLYGKMLKNANIGDKMTTRAREITLAKSLSYIYMLWGMPEVVLINLAIAIQVSAKQPQVGGDLAYSWNATKIPLDGYHPINPFISTTGIIPTTNGLKVYNPNRRNYQIEAIHLLTSVLDRYLGPQNDNEAYVIAGEKAIVYDYTLLFKIVDTAVSVAYSKRTGDSKKPVFSMLKQVEKGGYIMHDCDKTQIYVESGDMIETTKIACDKCFTRESLHNKYPIIMGGVVPMVYADYNTQVKEALELIEKTSRVVVMEGCMAACPDAHSNMLYVVIMTEGTGYERLHSIIGDTIKIINSSDNQLIDYCITNKKDRRKTNIFIITDIPMLRGNNSIILSIIVPSQNMINGSWPIDSHDNIFATEQKNRVITWASANRVNYNVSLSHNDSVMRVANIYEELNNEQIPISKLYKHKQPDKKVENQTKDNRSITSDHSNKGELDPTSAWNGEIVDIESQQDNYIH